MKKLSRGGLLALVSIFVVGATAGCASPRRGAPLRGAITLDDKEAQGRLVFMHECHQCHPGGEGAVGPAINNKPIPRPIMKLQVRTGVLGSMPAFSKEEISESELDAVMDYVVALRRHRS
jgi:mono/diheme cytochrome c family protein